MLIWAFTSPGGLFWAIFPLVGWGIGVVMNGWDVYVAEDLDEEQIDREVERLEHRH